MHVARFSGLPSLAVVPLVLVRTALHYSNEETAYYREQQKRRRCAEVARYMQARHLHALSFVTARPVR